MRARKSDQLRNLEFIAGVNLHAEGSLQIQMGNTIVYCACSVDDRVPPFQKEKNEGWVTAEYSMLPRATSSRNQREAQKGKLSGRTMEIQRLIGRSLRSVIDFSVLSGFCLTIDCDVLQADGGTRTASITGGFLAMSLACQQLLLQGKIPAFPIKDTVAAVSVGIVNGQVLLDLDYQEDSSADVDLNLVMTGSGKIVEVQGTAEHQTYSQSELLSMIDTGSKGILTLQEVQKRILSGEKQVGVVF